VAAGRLRKALVRLASIFASTVLRNTRSCLETRRRSLEREYRNSNESNGKGRKQSVKGGGSYKKLPHKQVTATLAAQIDKWIEDKLKTAEDKATSEEQIQTYLVSLVTGKKAMKPANASSISALPPAPTDAPAPVTPLISLTDILKFAKKENGLAVPTISSIEGRFSNESKCSCLQCAV